MYVNLSIMQPNEGFRSETTDSMRWFAAAPRAEQGCVTCAAFTEGKSDALYGIAVRESEDAARAAGPTLMAAVANDDFDTWVAEMQNHLLTEV